MAVADDQLTLSFAELVLRGVCRPPAGADADWPWRMRDAAAAHGFEVEITLPRDPSGDLYVAIAGKDQRRARARVVGALTVAREEMQARRVAFDSYLEALPELTLRRLDEDLREIERRAERSLDTFAELFGGAPIDRFAVPPDVEIGRCNWRFERAKRPNQPARTPD
jgi:hypothetical protein